MSLTSYDSWDDPPSSHDQRWSTSMINEDGSSILIQYGYSIWTINKKEVKQHGDILNQHVFANRDKISIIITGIYWDTEISSLQGPGKTQVRRWQLNSTPLSRYGGPTATGRVQKNGLRQGQGHTQPCNPLGSKEHSIIFMGCLQKSFPTWHATKQVNALSCQMGCNCLLSKTFQKSFIPFRPFMGFTDSLTWAPMGFSDSPKVKHLPYRSLKRWIYQSGNTKPPWANLRFWFVASHNNGKFHRVTTTNPTT